VDTGMVTVTSTGTGTDTAWKPHARFVFPEMLLGVTSEVVSREGGSPGSNAPFVGLIKYRKSWIRPTFLGQTDISSFALDFTDDSLTLSRRELIPRGAPRVLPMVDLRPMGAPVFHYAVLVEELWINGERHRPEGDRPVYVVFDSGTTGMLVDRNLFDTSEFGLGTFECHMRLRAEDGSLVTVGNSRKTCTNKCLFVTLPIDVLWTGFENCHIIFAGLALMFNQGSLTVDADTRRLKLGGSPGPLVCEDEVWFLADA